MMHPFDLGGTVALVVGGRGFLGRRFCTALRGAGAVVCSADRPLQSRAAALDSSAGPLDDIEPFDVDAVDPASVEALVSRVVAGHGRIDTLVFSVTTKPQDFYKAYTECSLTGWQEILRVELDGAFVVTQRVGAAMEKHGGSMTLLSSIYGVVGNDQRIYEGANLDQVYGDAPAARPRIYAHAGYATAKGGLIALTRYLAAYWGHAGVRVNCVSPGGVSHPAENAAFVRQYSEHVPLGRKATVDDVAGAVLYLASPAAAYVTGHNLLVDGGWTAW
jgi:NAD(P)-dependent dehydrogenase (short-subunit alcohol dehydrogenase family)